MSNVVWIYFFEANPFHLHAKAKALSEGQGFRLMPRAQVTAKGLR